MGGTTQGETPNELSAFCLSLDYSKVNAPRLVTAGQRATLAAYRGIHEPKIPDETSHTRKKYVHARPVPAKHNTPTTRNHLFVGASSEVSVGAFFLIDRVYEQLLL